MYLVTFPFIGHSGRCLADWSRKAHRRAVFVYCGAYVGQNSLRSACHNGHRTGAAKRDRRVFSGAVKGESGTNRYSHRLGKVKHAPQQGAVGRVSAKGASLATVVSSHSGGT